MVKINEPTANGATFPNSDGPGDCYAEFGMTHVASSENYQTCHFPGIGVSCWLIITSYLTVFKQAMNSKR